MIETHFAWVFLTDRCAYKLKKPVQRAGLDYRTMAVRQARLSGRSDSQPQIGADRLFGHGARY